MKATPELGKRAALGEGAHAASAAKEQMKEGLRPRNRPVLLQIGAWSRAHLPETRHSDPRALAINRQLVGSRAAMRRKMAELRAAHLVARER